MKKNITSTCGTATPRCEEIFFTNTLNLGLRAFAAGPPSVPNSLNLQPEKVHFNE
jgi:hypothetical protein